LIFLLVLFVLDRFLSDQTKQTSVSVIARSSSSRKKQGAAKETQTKAALVVSGSHSNRVNVNLSPPIFFPLSLSFSRRITAYSYAMANAPDR